MDRLSFLKSIAIAVAAPAVISEASCRTSKNGEYHLVAKEWLVLPRTENVRGIKMLGGGFNKQNNIAGLYRVNESTLTIVAEVTNFSDMSFGKEISLDAGTYALLVFGKAVNKKQERFWAALY
jgi:hypothetical protein